MEFHVFQPLIVLLNPSGKTQIDPKALWLTMRNSLLNGNLQIINHIDLEVIPRGVKVEMAGLDETTMVKN